MGFEGCPNTASRSYVPSKEQIIDAIYETVVSPQLFDRFSQSETRLKASPDTGSPALVKSGAAKPELAKPAAVAPEFASHFARANELLRDQWIRKNRPDPAYIYADGGGTWVIATCDGRALRCSRRARQQIGFLPHDVLQAFEVETLPERRAWAEFSRRLAAGELSHDDFLVLKTARPDLCLLCRPVSAGAITSESAVAMIEALEAPLIPQTLEFLRNGFGLDGGQIKVLGDLLRGVPLADLPRDTLAQVIAKAGAPGGAELVRLAAFLLKEHASDLAIADGSKLPPSGSLSCCDGGRMQYIRLGADTGQPVIFIHGLLDCVAGILRLQPQLRQLGFKVYVPLRNGYGASGPVPPRRRHLEVFCEQFDALLQQENLQRPILLAHRGGMVFAQAVAVRWRDRIAGIVAVSASGPLKTIRDFATLRGYQKVFAICSVCARPLLPLLMRGWSRSVRKAGVEVLISRQSTPGSLEAERVANMNLAPLLRHSHDFAMQQGGAGFIADIDLVLRDWRPLVTGRAGGGPLVYLYGSQDPAVQSGARGGATHSGQDVQYRLCEGADGTLLYTRPELILAALSDIAQSRRGTKSQASSGAANGPKT